MPVTGPEPRGFAAPPAQLDAPALEAEVRRRWQRDDVEGRSLRGEVPHAEGEFVFFDGPPFATGLPHYGHLLASTIKDVVPRYWTMRGRRVERRFGWDCHGLPIESAVEDQLGVHGRAEIEALGVPAFNAACRRGVLTYTAEWEGVIARLGRWVDFRNDYKTMDPSFMESVWWVFRQLWDRGLIYEGHRVQPVSPALGTPLSNFEVAQGPMERDPVTRKESYKRRQDPSVIVRFRLEDEPECHLWAWTTTPWTLPSNLALAVHPEVEYVEVRVEATGERAILEPGRLADLQARGRIGPTVELARMPGRALAGRPYAPLFPFFADLAQGPDGRRRAFYVVLADYVTTDAGTGVVHQAPAFGEDDFQTGQREGLPLVNPLDLNGIFDGTVGPFAGLFAKDADRPILQALKAAGQLVDEDTIVHPYPHCYRTEQPLLYMAISTWFMRVEPLRERLVAHNELIRWVPAHVGSGRFGNWLAAARDWNLSRNRYWGTPLPIWRCDKDPSELVCVGSRAELERLAGLAPGSLVDLHRESIDAIEFPAARTPGGTMRRVFEVFDCWFESGSMPYAQNHYPFDPDKRAYVERNLPADFIAEGLDQTRGWFYTLHVLSTALFDRPAFRNVVVNGLILAADGKKMSKRLKNYPDPQVLLDRHGADALRAYLISGPVVRGEPMRFGKHADDLEGEAVKDTVRSVILPLWNAYQFLVLYARAEGWAPTGLARPEASHPLDRWLLSRIQSFVARTRREFESYRLDNLVGSLTDLSDELNNWYIRRGRRRFWRVRGDDRGDQAQAFATLHFALVTIAHAMAPVLPFFCDWLFQRLVVDLGLAAPTDSVHLRPYPEVEPAVIDAELEAQVAAVRRVVRLGLALRERAGIGARRPLPGVTVASPDPALRSAVERFASELEAELNVRRVAVAADDAELVELSAKCNFKALGRRLGPKMKAVAAAVEALDGAAVRGALAQGGLEVAGEHLSLDELIIRREPLDRLAVESDGELTLLLDTTIDRELALEGLARELVNRVQQRRKAAGLQVTDRIELWIRTGGRLLEALDEPSLRALIAVEVLVADDRPLVVEPLADPAAAGPPADAHVHRDEVDGEAVELALRVRAR